eukprot:5896035-Pyramimonas_sp.AAC.2
MAGRRARTMSTACAASGRLACPACNLDVTSKEGLSTNRKRCRSSLCCFPGSRPRNIFSMSSLAVPAARARSTTLVSLQGAKSLHGSPSIRGLCDRGSVRPVRIVSW